MKILHTADWHIGQFKGPVVDGVNLRSQDTVKCLEYMVQVAIEEKPDIVCVSGDIFHQEQVGPVRYSDEMITATNIITSLAHFSKYVIVMRGTPNHDGAAQFRVLERMLLNIRNVDVVTEPGVIKTPWADIACLPGFDKQEFRAKFPGLSADEENLAWTKYISEMVFALRAECEKTPILMAHYTVPGCNMESGQTSFFTNFEPVIPREALMAARYEAVLLGHIHRPQIIEGLDNVFYSGAINAMNFNDEGQDRGFWIHEFNEKGTLVKGHKYTTPYRQFHTMQDFIVGPFDQTIKTANFPVLASIVGLAYDGGTPFQAEIYFINLAQIVQIKFGVPFFDVYDPRFDDFGVPVAVRGTISFKITDYRQFIKLHRLSNFNLDDFQKQIRDVVIRYVKDIVANAPAIHNIPLVRIEAKISEINDAIEYDIGKRLKEDFGVDVSGIDIGTIEIDKSSEGYRQLMSVTKDVTTVTIKAETAAKVKDITDRQRIDVEHYGESLRIQREESQYAQHKQTQTNNLGAFQVEKQAEVGVAGAEALGKMGANGAGNVNLSGGGDGFNMAAMMASMAVGGAVGQNIAGSMNNMMAGMNQPVQNGITPPPVPGVSYYVGMNGQATGPYDFNTLRQMMTAGQFTSDSLVWKTGMPEWAKASSVDEMKQLLPDIPPIPKKN